MGEMVTSEICRHKHLHGWSSLLDQSRQRNARPADCHVVRIFISQGRYQCSPVTPLLLDWPFKMRC
jgi:hypothetical protein